MSRIDEWIHGFLHNTPVHRRPLLSDEEAERMMEIILAMHQDEAEVVTVYHDVAPLTVEEQVWPTPERMRTLFHIR